MAMQGMPQRGAPLQGLYSSDNVPHGDTGRDPSEWGTPADPRHAGPDTSKPRYRAQPYGAQVQADDEVESTPLAGLPAQWTPNAHAGPYPAGLTHDPLVAADQLRRLHGAGDGSHAVVSRANTPPYTDTPSPESGRWDSPNQNVLAAVPGQLKSGSDDTEQGYGAENGHGFNLGRQFRRWFSDPVPLDRTATRGGDRPFYGHHKVRQPVYDADSEYGPVTGDTHTGMMLRPTPTGYPTPYEQPPDPLYRPTAEQSSEASFSGGWVAG